MPTQNAHTLRIIGGQWRSRRIDIETAEGLRPTPDRVRETLFNWLAPRIPGTRCLDLFAGTGALGLEALSRGAAHVTFIERDNVGARALHRALTTLGSDGGKVVHADAMQHAALLEPGYDIVFLDPPFTTNLHAAALATIKPLIAPNARAYMEYPATQAEQLIATLPKDWQLLRSKRAGQVGYCLVCDTDEEP